MIALGDVSVTRKEITIAHTRYMFVTQFAEGDRRGAAVLPPALRDFFPKISTASAISMPTASCGAFFVWSSKC